MFRRPESSASAGRPVRASLARAVAAGARATLRVATPAAPHASQPLGRRRRCCFAPSRSASAEGRTSWSPTRCCAGRVDLRARPGCVTLPLLAGAAQAADRAARRAQCQLRRALVLAGAQAAGRQPAGSLALLDYQAGGNDPVVLIAPWRAALRAPDFGQLTGAGWTSWFGDVVPRACAGAYFAAPQPLDLPPRPASASLAGGRLHRAARARAREQAEFLGGHASPGTPDPARGPRPAPLERLPQA